MVKQTLAIGQSESSRKAGLRVHIDQMDSYASTAEQDSNCRRSRSFRGASFVVRDRNHVHVPCLTIALAFCHAPFSGSEAVQACWRSGIATILAVLPEFLLICGR
jgi:hypothetical protein